MTEASRIVRALAERAQSAADEVAFRFAERPDRAAKDLTRGALWARALATGARVSERAGPGERIGIACTSLEDYVVALAACLASGFVAVPLPTALSRRSAPRALSVLSVARPRAVLVTGAAPDWLPLEAPAVAVAGEAPVPDPATAGVPMMDAPALIQFSSGSTGDPKGVELTHANLAANCADIAGAFGLGPHSRGFSWLPLHHDMGLVGHVLTPFWVGGVQTLASPLSFVKRPLSWLEFVSRERATITSAPNFAYEVAARAAEGGDVSGLDLGSLTAAVCGGERVVKATVERFIAAFAGAGFDPSAMAPSYGLAEATLLVASGRRPGGPRFVPVAGGEAAVDLGRPVDGVSVRVVRDDGSIAADGEIGELEISGASVGRLVGAAVDETRHVRTGDSGFLKDGRLRVTGRLKDIIIVRGQNIGAGDVEIAALSASDAVQPGGACAMADERDGTEELVVIVEKTRGASLTSPALARAVTTAVAVAIGVVPGRVLVAPVGALPRTPSGKVQRHVTREMMLAGSLRLL